MLSGVKSFDFYLLKKNILYKLTTKLKEMNVMPFNIPYQNGGVHESPAKADKAD